MRTQSLFLDSIGAEARQADHARLTARGKGRRLAAGSREFNLQRLFLFAAVLILYPLASNAQWTNQTITLRAGWNAVYLELQPEPSDCNTLFAGLPVESAWGWNRRFSPVQYIQDPNELVPGQPDWLTWLTTTNQSQGAVSLHILQSDHSYLIKLPNNASPVSWTIRGRALARNTEWLSDSFNFVGFHVDPATPPTFQSYFAPSPAHAGRPIYRLNSLGAWSQVNAATDRPNRGEAYWVECVGQSTYAGPLSLTLEQGRGLDYGRILVEQTLRIRNASTNSRTITIKQAGSGDPPTGDYPARPGDVPLSSWKMILPGEVGFFPFPAQLTNTLPAGAEWPVRLAVRRMDMVPYTPPPGVTDVLYQSLLQITDGAGTRLLVPVTAKGLQSYSAEGGGGASPGFAPASAAPPDIRAGLWVGNAVISNVNQAAISDVPVPTASEFQFRLILHVDASGEVRLLQKVIVAWTNGVYTVNPQGFKEAVSPGRYALLTDDSLISHFSGSALRDGTATGRRISSAAFGFREPILMGRTASFGNPAGLFSCTVSLGYDDGLNPFKHKFHPDHNNLNNRYDGVQRECPDVSRQVSFQFTAQDPDQTTLAGWGDNQLGGIYREVITGLHKAPLHIQGIFRLHRVSSVPILNDLPL